MKNSPNKQIVDDFAQSYLKLVNGNAKVLECNCSELLNQSVSFKKARLKSHFVKTKTNSRPIENTDSFEFEQNYIFNDSVIHGVKGTATVKTDKDSAMVNDLAIKCDTKKRYKAVAAATSAFSAVLYIIMTFVTKNYEAANPDMIHPYLLIRELMITVMNVSLAVFLAGAVYLIYLFLYKRIGVLNRSIQKSTLESMLGDTTEFECELAQRLAAIHYSSLDKINDYAGIDLTPLYEQYKDIIDCSVDVITYTGVEKNDEGKEIISISVKMNILKFENDKIKAESEKVYLRISINDNAKILDYVSNSMYCAQNNTNSGKAIFAGKNYSAKKTITICAVVITAIVLLVNLTSIRVILRDTTGSFEKNYDREYFIGYDFVPSIVHSLDSAKEIKSKYLYESWIDSKTDKEVEQRTYYYKYRGEFTNSVINGYALDLGDDSFKNSIEYTQNSIELKRKAKLGTGTVTVSVSDEEKDGVLKVVVRID